MRRWIARIDELSLLTHWGRVTHICVGNLTIIGSYNGLSPGRRHAIIWTNAGILLIGPSGTNFSEILIEIHKLSLKTSSNIVWNMAAILSRPQCVNVFAFTELPAGTFSWRRRDMETLFSRLPARCGRNPPLTGGFHSQSWVMRSYDVLFALSPNKGLHKQYTYGWLDWIGSLLHHYNVDFLNTGSLGKFNQNIFSENVSENVDCKMSAISLSL